MCIRDRATDLARHGIAVGALHPGWVRTAMGGAGADIPVEESGAGVKAVIEGITPAATGCFWTWAGALTAW